MTSLAFDNSYARLPDRFFARRTPTPVAQPRLIRLNTTLLAHLGLDAGLDWAAVVAGNQMPPGAEPIALAYAGHQFGHFTPQLGDGRAVLLGEVVATNGQRYDLQLKGSGPTMFSRGGDGRAALGPVLREYIVSEAMTALGIPSTRALAAVTTGEIVRRETGLPGAVLARVAASHIRVGTFQYFAARRDAEALRLLADHAIARHYPEAEAAPNPYRALLQGVIARQAGLVARWLQVGFIHGVMNTDNTAISGETIDYGPCAFLDEYDPAAVFSSIDHAGRYAFANQPGIAQWNMARLAECLLLLMDDDVERALAMAREDLAGFGPQFEAAHMAGMRHKLGLARPLDGDGALIEDWLALLEAGRADFTLGFRGLAAAAEDDAPAWLVAVPGFDAWAARWRARLGDEKMAPAARAGAMRAVNPAVIPRNHRIEAVIRAAVDEDDFAPFHALVTRLETPFADLPGGPDLLPPRADERVQATFCGT